MTFIKIPEKKRTRILLAFCSIAFVAVFCFLVFFKEANRTSIRSELAKERFTVKSKQKNETVNASTTAITPANQKTSQTIKATLSEAIKPLPLYGFNGEISSNTPVWANQAFRDSVASLYLKAIRYPGGTTSNFWDWRKGGVVSDMSGTMDNASKKIEKLKSIESHNLTDLKILVDKTGCDVVFVLNMISRDLQDQLAMLQTAQVIGIPIKWVELGNEFYLQKSPGKYKFSTPADYGKTAQQWISTIKNMFKDVKIAVVGSTGTDNWNEQVLQNAPGADAIVAHLYPQPDNILDGSGINFSKLDMTLANKINKFYLQQKDFPVWVTEYNIHWTATGDKKGVEKKEIQSYASTWSQTLAVLLMTSEISTMIDNVPILLNHNVSNWPGFAAIETQKGTFHKLPNGIGMEAWLNASNGMNQMQKINLGQADYDLLGWKFSNSLTSKQTLLLANFTSAKTTIDLSSLLHGNEMYKTEFAAKNAVINSWLDVQRLFGKVQNKTVDLPPYCITIVN